MDTYYAIVPYNFEYNDETYTLEGYKKPSAIYRSKESAEAALYKANLALYLVYPQEDFFQYFEDFLFKKEYSWTKFGNLYPQFKDEFEAIAKLDNNCRWMNWETISSIGKILHTVLSNLPDKDAGFILVNAGVSHFVIAEVQLIDGE